MNRTLVAALLAPALPCVAGAAWVAFQVSRFTGGPVTAILYGLSLASAFGVIGYTTLLLLGMPVHFFLLRRRRWFSWLAYACSGVCSAFALFALVDIALHVLGFVDDDRDWRRKLLIYAILTSYGGAVGFTFWIIARPDKNATP
ncbi:MAG TPA: hypothetical protein VMA53_20725 [Stellaceae bacterium]|nr:hypothetical protein [Stellaceae bacterium]